MSLTIKPLIWTRGSVPKGWPIDHPVYEVRILMDQRLFTIVCQPSGAYLNPGRLKPFPTLAAAQAAATMEWETCIRAAVEETPALFPCPPLTGMDRPPPRREGWIEVGPAAQKATIEEGLRMTTERDRGLLSPEEIATAKANIRAGLNVKP